MASKSKISFAPGVYIDLKALSENVRALKETVAPAKLCCVVKADAYGHGMVEVSTTAERSGASCLAVATVNEGVVLRESGVKLPILLLSETGLDELEEAVSWGLTLTIVKADTFKVLLRRIQNLNDKLKANPTGFGSKISSCFGYKAKFPIKPIFSKQGKKVPVHLKFETGMSRLGGTQEELLKIISLKQDLIEVESIWTHMATADIKGHINNKTQIDRFNSFVQFLKDDYSLSFKTHMANTAAALTMPETRLDLVRAGLGIYGYYPAEWISKLSNIKKVGPILKPVKSVKVAIENLTAVKAGQGVSYGHNFVAKNDTTVATVQIGYADGLFRSLSNAGGKVLICGQRCNIVGNITMNHTMIDVGHLMKKFKLERGEEVVILGSQETESTSLTSAKTRINQIDADFIADKANTISYEVLTNLGHTCTKIFNKAT
jgi:alanine racemase